MDRRFGSLIVKRVIDTSTIETIDMTLNMEKFAHKVALKIDEEFHILRERVKKLEEKLYLGKT